MISTQTVGQHCPYLVVAIFSGRMPQIVGRTFNRADAEAHVRFLQRRLAAGSFFVAFEPKPKREIVGNF
jgi:hypothetical protein